MCRKKARDSKTPEQVHRVDADSPVDEYPMYTVHSDTAKPLMVEINLNGVNTKMEVNMGASVSIMVEESFQLLQEMGATLHPTTVKLSTDTGESIPARVYS